MKSVRNALLALGLLCGATQADAAGISGTATIDKNYAHSVWNWEKMGETHIFWEIYNTDGYLTVCGGYATRGPSATMKFTRLALRDSVVTMNGKAITTNLDWFTRVVNSGKDLDFVGQQVNCKVTSTPTPAKDADVEFELRSRKDTYRG
ncbi:hypothetical protein [Celeribacter sp. SCSIO 80788]|jgi:hypothetical protein|uniref:hypothetical protein n=1 Tax=Celeribacter sp. SCSIO 80788 TaxID=3117013 RepID=UPI003DA59FD6